MSSPGQDDKRPYCGRKGDPRMHKAVAARLQNPEISLFDALKAGGFEYPSNNDSSAMDSEKVTLGQRKNQLSRRLRLARKNNGDGADEDDPTDAAERSILDGNSVVVSNSSKSRKSGSGTDRPSSKVGARALQMKREVDFALDDDSTSKRATSNSTTTGLPGSAMETGTPGIGTLASYQLEQASKRPRVAKFHPDYAPVIVPPASFRSRNHNGSFDSTNRSANSLGSALEEGIMNPIPTLNSTAASGISTNPSAIPGLTDSFPPLSSSYGGLSGSYGGLIGGSGTSSYSLPSTTFNSTTSMFSTPQSRPSAVAVSSLTSSAQAVGLTLEQLALSLSSNTTALAKLVSETRSGQSVVQQLDLAMNLYRTEIKTLYTRCMLQAGIDPSLAQPDTPTYLDFASKAWQREGKRIEEMMGKARMDNGASGFSDLDQIIPAAVGTPSSSSKTQNTVDGGTSTGGNENDTGSTKPVASSGTLGASSIESSTTAPSATHDLMVNGHGHDHGHDHTSCDANHVHQLGQCGHRAIIHHPPEGSPHIDFIVGDHVECYAGIDSVPLGRNVDSMWPSQFKCKDVEDTDGCTAKVCAKTIAGSSLDGYWSASDSIQGSTEPKILKLADVNLQDPEWNYDSDGGVLGLFKLGENEVIGDNDESKSKSQSDEK